MGGRERGGGGRRRGGVESGEDITGREVTVSVKMLGGNEIEKCEIKDEVCMINRRSEH